MKFDIVIIGGGLAGTTAGVELLKRGRKCCIVSEGLSLHHTPMDEYLALGGTLLPGDSVTAGIWEEHRLKAVLTRNLGNTPLEADTFLLCTGKFFSKGLRATMDSIVEPIFGADVEFDPCRDRWYDSDFHAPQPFERFGVKTDAEGRVLIAGTPCENLIAAGEILAGEIDIIKSAKDVCRILI